VRDLQGAGLPDVGLLVPGVGADLGHLALVVAGQLVDAGVSVAPDPQQLPGEVDGWAGAAVRDGVEGALGELEPAAGVLHVGPGAADVAGVHLSDLDGGGDLGDSAGLLDGGGLADADGRDGGQGDGVRGAHAAYSSACWFSNHGGRDRNSTSTG
jgi:hypothetical protein